MKAKLVKESLTTLQSNEYTLEDWEYYLYDLGLEPIQINKDPKSGGFRAKIIGGKIMSSDFTTTRYTGVYLAPKDFYKMDK